MKEKINVVFTGDVYINTQKISLSNQLSNFLNFHDIISCNFEGPIFTSSQFSIDKAGPCLSQNKDSIKFLRDKGFNLFNLSNNHIMDYGRESLERTIELLPKDSYLGAGLSFEKAFHPIVKEIKGRRIGFLSFAEWGFGAIDGFNKEGFAWVNHPKVNSIVEKTKKEVDFLVLQIHAGVEDIDLPIPEWRERYKELIDFGADIIIGHHPHVPQGWEKHKGKYIFYSLGNFYMDLSNKEYDKSFILSLTLDQSLKLSFEIIPISKKKNKINLSSDKDLINDLTKKLNSKDYYSNINSICCDLWHNRYKRCYYSALNSPVRNGGLFFNLINVKKWLFSKEINKNLLLHNLKIESHRYCVERYLRISNKNE
jgi:poly-gamma-glutamate synthesis protein (capsule biosynthesis protein)